MNAPDPIAAILRGDVALRWVPIAGTDLEVMTDGLRVEQVRAPVSARTAQRIADLLTLQDPEGHAVSLSTPAVVDLVFQQAELRPPPMTLWAPGRGAGFLSFRAATSKYGQVSVTFGARDGPERDVNCARWT